MTTLPEPDRRTWHQYVRAVRMWLSAHSPETRRDLVNKLAGACREDLLNALHETER